MILPGSKSIYSYDHIGNRTTLQEGGDGMGNNLRTTNTLNQYTSATSIGPKVGINSLFTI